MKTKNIIGLFIALFIISNLNAQTAIGLKFGIQISKLKPDWTYNSEIEYESATAGANIGAIFNFGYDNLVSFQMELNYSQKGSIYGFAGEDYKLVFEYIELPLLLKFSFGKSDLKYFGLVGPYAAYPVIMKETYVDEEYSMDLRELWEFGGSEFIVLGIQIGGGITYDMGPGRLLVELRYCLGLNSLMWDYYDDDEVLYDSNVLQLSIGYLFTFGK